jgi:hypothetical protein
VREVLRLTDLDHFPVLDAMRELIDHFPELIGFDLQKLGSLDPYTGGNAVFLLVIG